MNDKKLMELAGLLDDDLITRAAGTVGQKENAMKKKSALKAALIAACVCLALVGMAFAADSLGLFGQTTTIEQKDDGNYTAENVQSLKLYPIDQFSPALQADWERLNPRVKTDGAISLGGPPDGGITRFFDSWQEARDYVGVPLAENPLLDSKELFAPQWGKETHPYYALQVRVYPGAVLVWRSYEMDGVSLSLHCTILTEAYNGSNSGGGIQGDEVEVREDGTAVVKYVYDRYAGLFNTRELIRAETRTTADGGEALFVNWNGGNSEYEWYGARFVHNGMDYSVSASDAKAERAYAESAGKVDIGFDHTLDYWGVLQRVVDGFVFK